MAVHKRSDAAAATAVISKTFAKVSKPKTRAPKVSLEIGQHSLHPQRNSSSPMENDTNSHIARINLNRDRFTNVLTTLGGMSPRKNTTPPKSPTDPLDKPEDLPLPPRLDYEEPDSNDPHECSPSMVRINKTPTSVATIGSPQAEPQKGEEEHAGASRRPILRRNNALQLQQQEKRQPRAATIEQGDGVIHNRANKLLREVKSGHEAYSFHIEDFTGLFPVWPILELAMLPTGQTKDEKMNKFVKCVTSLFGEILIVDEKAAIEK